MPEPTLEAGSFYWVKPVFDVDFTPDGFDFLSVSDELFEASYKHWSQSKQPALFKGYDQNNQEMWVYLGQDEDNENYWPVCWIGNKIEN